VKSLLEIKTEMSIRIYKFEICAFNHFAIYKEPN